MISVTILTKNSAETIEKTLLSVKDFPEVLVIDTGSNDETLEIVRRYSFVRVVTVPFQGFGRTHNIASALATYEYILSIDSDEVLSPELTQEILQCPLNPRTVYAIQRKNYFQGKWISGCSGWHPDVVVRLYHRQETSFTSEEVHEKVRCEGLSYHQFCHVLYHEPYRHIRDFLCKMQNYSDLFAKQHQGKKSSSFSKALLHGVGAFGKSYILKRGMFLGKEGFLISLYNGETAFYKYLKLLEANKSHSEHRMSTKDPSI